MLCLHRIPGKKGESRPTPGSHVGKPVVYMHHGSFRLAISASGFAGAVLSMCELTPHGFLTTLGLLMNSEVWVCLTEEERCLPFALAEKGYDVWVRGRTSTRTGDMLTGCFSPPPVWQ